MKLFIVENEPLMIADFLAAINSVKWSYLMFPHNDDTGADEKSIRHFLIEVSKERPDVVVLDAALTIKEEKLLDELTLEGEDVSENSLSGFKYCRALASERLGIPIVFLTKYGDGQVARIAMRVGADRVLTKRSKNEDLIQEIDDLVKAKTPHDPSFYWPTREKLDSQGNDMWQGESLRNALDRFFMNISSVRRFGLFTATLRDILSPLFKGNLEAEQKLMLSLVKSQVLLSLVDPRLRDHVKHTGNVFWVGYRLLHDIPEFNEPEKLNGAITNFYKSSGSIPPRDQLLYAWTLAALFHDFGYVDERQIQLTALVKSLIPSMTIELSEVRNEASWIRNMNLLKDFASTFPEPNKFLFHYVDNVVSKFGLAIINGGKTIKAVDHGFLSAHRMLDMIPIDTLDSQKKKIVLHAALAIAYHNYAEIIHKWDLDDKCKGMLSIGVLPVCSLLAFCDNIQTWDRESDVDPALARTEAYDGILERLVLSDTAYVSGSEICEFSTSLNADKLGYDIKIRLRYFVESGVEIQKACESLGHDIQRWIDSEKLKEVCDRTGMSSLLNGEIVYELPMLAGIRKATF